jgi:hypothetical protein
MVLVFEMILINTELDQFSKVWGKITTKQSFSSVEAEI